MKSENELRDKSNKSGKDKAILKALEYLHPYVKHRLYVAESEGLLAKNQFNSHDVIDESIITLYANKAVDEYNDEDIKISLFKVANTKLINLIRSEGRKPEQESLEVSLADELYAMETEFFGSGDGEALLKEEFFDITYLQDIGDGDVYSDENENRHLLESMDVHIDAYHECCNAVAKFYNWVPERIANIIDLQAFGRLNANEISKVLKLDEEKITYILNHIPKHFRSHQHS